MLIYILLYSTQGQSTLRREGNIKKWTQQNKTKNTLPQPPPPKKKQNKKTAMFYTVSEFWCKYTCVI